MHPLNITVPCSPGDTIYYLKDEYTLIRLFVTQIQIVQDINGNLSTAICFPNYPFILIDELENRVFSTYEEGYKHLKERPRRRKRCNE